MAILMSCDLAADAILEELKHYSNEHAAKKDFVPTLGIITSGTDLASEVYVRNKKKDCEALGFGCIVQNMNGSIIEQDYIDAVMNMGQNSMIHGIIVQLPLPSEINSSRVIQFIPPNKDVDGLTAYNIGNAQSGNAMFKPCTPMGIMFLLDYYSIPLEGKHVVILGRSNIVGRPLAEMMLERNATVTVCHSKTKNLSLITQDADILVSAIGKPKFVKGHMVKANAVVIDVGINRDENNKLCGDVDFDSVSPVAEYITKVPGGVGLLTRAELMQAIYIAAWRFKQ